MLAADVCALCIYTVVLCVVCWVCVLCWVCLVLYTLYLCVNVINVNMPAVCMCIQLLTVHACKHSTLHQGLGAEDQGVPAGCLQECSPYSSLSVSDRHSPQLLGQ